MKTKNRNKWLIGFAAVIILVGLVLGFSRSNLLTGKIVTLRQPPIMLLSVRCKEIRGWMDVGTLSGNMGGDWTDYNRCIDSYPDIMYKRFTSAYCNALANLERRGLISPSFMSTRPELARDPMWCAIKMPNVWYGFPSETSCSVYGGWFRRELLTANLIPSGLDSGFVYRSCEESYPRAFFGARTRAYCGVLRRWFDSGELSRSHIGDMPEASWCASNMPYDWYGMTSRETCVLLRRWLDERSLSANMIRDGLPPWLPGTCSSMYPEIWPDGR